MYDFMKLTERDQEILTWIARHSFVTAKQIETAFGVSRQISYRILRKLKEYEYVKNELVMRTLGLFYATEDGIEVAGIDMTPLQRVNNLAEIRHELMINDLEVTLMLEAKRQGQDFKWVTSREIKRRKYKNAERIEGSNLVKGQKDDLPDAYWLQNGNTAAIEVELTRKDKKRIQEKFKTYDAELAANRIQAVFYYTDKQTIKNLLESQRGVMEHKSRLIIRDFPKVGE
ncbi:replication-relaxation family protein [Ectobacillus panaciterrae]|uniref:replication-relaxation family protein n=1 Tax=Ectobacillus panaciterrae TaxID=363872 RepID=UPI0003FD164A|nr:replication-relaxation family protein [Ectobacillus panaciterrae]